MVSIIAAVLAAHKFTRTGHCECGARVHPFALPEDVAAHQARAVLDAISEAGGIPATICGHFIDTQGEEFGPSSPCVSALGHPGYHKDSKGMAFGPWTAVEG